MWGTIAGRIVRSLGKICTATRDIFGKNGSTFGHQIRSSFNDLLGLIFLIRSCSAGPPFRLAGRQARPRGSISQLQRPTPW